MLCNITGLIPPTVARGRYALLPAPGSKLFFTRTCLQPPVTQLSLFHSDPLSAPSAFFFNQTRCIPYFTWNLCRLPEFSFSLGPGAGTKCTLFILDLPTTGLEVFVQFQTQGVFTWPYFITEKCNTVYTFIYLEKSIIGQVVDVFGLLAVLIGFIWRREVWGSGQWQQEDCRQKLKQDSGTACRYGNQILMRFRCT